MHLNPRKFCLVAASSIAIASLLLPCDGRVQTWQENSLAGAKAYKLHDYATARDSYVAAVELLKSEKQADKSTLADLWINLATVQIASGQFNGARLSLDSAERLIVGGRLQPTLLELRWLKRCRDLAVGKKDSQTAFATQVRLVRLLSAIGITDSTSTIEEKILLNRFALHVENWDVAFDLMREFTDMSKQGSVPVEMRESVMLQPSTTIRMFRNAVLWRSHEWGEKRTLELLDKFSRSGARPEDVLDCTVAAAESSGFEKLIRKALQAIATEEQPIPCQLRSRRCRIITRLLFQRKDRHDFGVESIRDADLALSDLDCITDLDFKNTIRSQLFSLKSFILAQQGRLEDAAKVLASYGGPSIKVKKLHALGPDFTAWVNLIDAYLARGDKTSARKQAQVLDAVVRRQALPPSDARAAQDIVREQLSKTAR